MQRWVHEHIFRDGSTHSRQIQMRGNGYRSTFSHTHCELHSTCEHRFTDSLQQTAPHCKSLALQSLKDKHSAHSPLPSPRSRLLILRVDEPCTHSPFSRLILMKADLFFISCYRHTPGTECPVHTNTHSAAKPSASHSMRVHSTTKINPN